MQSFTSAQSMNSFGSGSHTPYTCQGTPESSHSTYSNCASFTPTTPFSNSVNNNLNKSNNLGNMQSAASPTFVMIPTNSSSSGSMQPVYILSAGPYDHNKPVAQIPMPNNNAINSRVFGQHNQMQAGGVCGFPVFNSPFSAASIFGSISAAQTLGSISASQNSSIASSQEQSSVGHETNNSNNFRVTSSDKTTLSAAPISSEQQPGEVCRHFVAGKCNRRKCRFPHILEGIIS